jgi:1-aminocyclopropane-1-carboxylate deaminase
MIKMSFPLPEKFAQIPRYQLLYSHASPIHPLKSLTPATGHHPNHPQISIFAKREDHSSPLACSGNKYRKLEYIVPDILSAAPKYGYHEHHPPREEDVPSRGPATILVTEGAIQSNHTVQVATLARKLGLKALVLLHRGTGGGLRTASDKESFLRTGNVQVNRLLGADVQVFEEGDPIADDANPVLEMLRRRGEIPYWIPGGASLHPLGGLGYARAAVEIAEQEQTLQLKGSGRFDVIFVACGSGSTHGGLIAGFKLLDKMGGSSVPRKLIGILNSPTKPRPYHEERVLTFARRAGAFIGLDAERDIGKEDVCLEDRFVGTGYGILDTHSSLALNNMAQMEGVILDPVYTAKVAWAMVHWVQEKEVRDYAEQHSLKHVNVLFIHTGGQAALGAYADRT